MPDKWRGTVNGGRIYVNFHIKSLFGGKEISPVTGKWRDPVNGGTVNRGLTVYIWGLARPLLPR